MKELRRIRAADDLRTANAVRVGMSGGDAAADWYTIKSAEAGWS